MSDYQPGTVAIATLRDGREVRVGRCRPANGLKDYWIEFGGPPSGLRTHEDEHVTDVRPLVVLDPEDGVVRDLKSAAYCPMDHGRMGRLRNLAGEIEAQTRPPKPAEPKGLGAVVEDSEHRLWIRHSNNPGTFPWLREGFVRGWSGIDAVTVLSEGVTR